MAVKPASPVIQTGHDDYTNLYDIWLFQSNTNGMLGNNFGMSGGSGTTFTYATQGDDGTVLDRTNAANNHRLTTSIVMPTKWSWCARIHLRSKASFGTLMTQGGTRGLYAQTSGTKWRFTWFTGGTNSTDLNYNQTYNIGVSCDTTLGTDNFKWYIDGVADGVSTTSVAATTWDSLLSNTLSEWCNCWLSVVAYWTAVRTSTQMANWNTDPYGVVRAAATTNTRNLLTSIQVKPGIFSGALIQ